MIPPWAFGSTTPSAGFLLSHPLPTAAHQEDFAPYLIELEHFSLLGTQPATSTEDAWGETTSSAPASSVEGDWSAASLTKRACKKVGKKTEQVEAEAVTPRPKKDQESAGPSPKKPKRRPAAPRRRACITKEVEKNDKQCSEVTLLLDKGWLTEGEDQHSACDLDGSASGEEHSEDFQPVCLNGEPLFNIENMMKVNEAAAVLLTDEPLGIVPSLPLPPLAQSSDLSPVENHHVQTPQTTKGQNTRRKPSEVQPERAESPTPLPPPHASECGNASPLSFANTKKVIFAQHQCTPECCAFSEAGAEQMNYQFGGNNFFTVPEFLCFMKDEWG